MSEELKPCPLCACADVELSSFNEEPAVYGVECGGCEFALAAETAEAATKRWNHRPLEAAAHERGRKEGVGECLSLIREVLDEASKPNTTVHWPYYMRKIAEHLESLLSERKGT